MFVEKNQDEKTFFCGWRKKDKSSAFQNDFVRIFFCLFYTVHTKCLFDSNFFAQIEIFHMNTKNFYLNFF